MPDATSSPSPGGRWSARTGRGKATTPQYHGHDLRPALYDSLLFSVASRCARCLGPGKPVLSASETFVYTDRLFQKDKLLRKVAPLPRLLRGDGAALAAEGGIVTDYIPALPPQSLRDSSPQGGADSYASRHFLAFPWGKVVRQDRKGEAHHPQYHGHDLRPALYDSLLFSVTSRCARCLGPGEPIPMPDATSSPSPGGRWSARTGRGKPTTPQYRRPSPARCANGASALMKALSVSGLRAHRKGRGGGPAASAQIAAPSTTPSSPSR